MKNLFRIEVSKNEKETIFTKWNLIKNTNESLEFVKRVEQFVNKLKNEDTDNNEYIISCQSVKYRTLEDKELIIKRKKLSLNFSLFRLTRNIKKLNQNEYYEKIKRKNNDLEKAKLLTFLNIPTFSVRLNKEEEIQILKILIQDERIDYAS
jgi:hypothetical protein